METTKKPFTHYMRSIHSKLFSRSHRTLYSDRLSNRKIRLLTILPSQDIHAPIRCKLHQYRVSAAPTYEGLSYVWGDPEDVVSIVCNGIEVNITSSLGSALWRIRDSRIPKVIWADALCINQRDVKEKSIHVPLMGRVFSRATNTVIYLGEANQEAALAAKAGLEAISNLIDDLRVKANLPTNNQDIFYGWILENLTEQSVPDVSWNAITQLFSVSWFLRTWCVQEIMLARDAPLDSYAIYGPVRIHHQHIAKVSLFLIITGKSGFKFSKGLGLLDPIAIVEYLDQVEEADRELLPVLAALSGHLATDPRDKVYGVLGILHHRFGYNTDSINVDYSKSVAQVYLDTAIEILRLKQNLTLFDHITQLEGFEDETEFATWVPRWDDLPDWILFGDEDMDEFRANCSPSPSANEPASTCWSVEGNRLLVSGSTCDSVISTSPLSGSDLMATFISHWRGTQAIRTSCFDYREDLLTMARTFRTGRVAMLLHFKEANDEQRDTFLADFMAYVHEAMPRCSLNCTGVPEDGNYVIDDIGTKRLGLAKRYASILVECCEGRSFFRTTQGHYGLGPHYIRPGDIVVGLIGASSPFALRRRGENHLLLGSVYVDELMDGKHFRRMLDAGEKETFTLI
ncbi:hypothetical protein OPT61_g1409 [Boeremia exigua]|uniref:Uncharacterized protein n=1 Tax=Boeremia exigua TaxID=749465 RepID=A0ACC2IQF4_9PLEO|nr:hypothetical protein OPT61_g1409 [Boeremia exigua]